MIIVPTPVPNIFDGLDANQSLSMLTLIRSLEQMSEEQKNELILWERKSNMLQKELIKTLLLGGFQSVEDLREGMQR
jgi:hypothetical protein